MSGESFHRPCSLLLEGMMVMMMMIQSKAWSSEGPASTVQATFLSLTIEFRHYNAKATMNST